MQTDAEVAAIAAGLSGEDADKMAGAWQGSSGRWYIDGRCKHLYAPGLCRLTGVLTDLGLRVAQHLKQENAK